MRMRSGPRMEMCIPMNDLLMLSLFLIIGGSRIGAAVFIIYYVASRGGF
jgi:hypothetical protein